ncbi:MAG: PspC domain-containing protein [Bacteroidetes bacterium]|nr:PspC domain-containing protein [Rhodothermia bacterium]MCS7154280.1 PspC domain-containing protein [Bacteroidota bacterium]MCX7906684.1 PspC domain-containing protein [Bacteroidota bacterium]MDW8137036.1 PspC domain-containing protein [Bacteroidota bacterium]MDW8285093.1 PspC domain-containing protein [Bacteroidota bacterium]
MAQLARSRTERKLLGVCGGLARYFGLDPTLVRAVYAALTLFSVGTGILVYLLLALVLPEE